jgi:hypothetical protein
MYTSPQNPLLPQRPQRILGPITPPSQRNPRVRVIRPIELLQRRRHRRDNLVHARVVLVGHVPDTCLVQERLVVLGPVARDVVDVDAAVGVDAHAEGEAGFVVFGFDEEGGRVARGVQRGYEVDGVAHAWRLGSRGGVCGRGSGAVEVVG